MTNYKTVSELVNHLIFKTNSGQVRTLLNEEVIWLDDVNPDFVSFVSNYNDSDRLDKNYKSLQSLANRVHKLLPNISTVFMGHIIFEY